MNKSTTKDQKNLQKSLFQEYTKVLIHSLTFVAALAWNSAFQKTFELMSSLELIGPWIYAILVSLICVGITVCCKRFLVE